MSTEAKVIVGIAFLSLVLLFGGVFFMSKQQPVAPSSQITDQKLLIREDSNKTSSAAAKVTLVEFGDYQCPACAASHPVVKQLINDHPSDVRFVFRHFPLPQHKNAKIAAEVAEAAGAQGKYFPMHEMLYENQREWSESSDPLPIFSKYALALGVDVAPFEEAVRSAVAAQKIAQDQQDGVTLGVNATPTFFINGTLFAGSDLKGSVEEALKK